MLMAWGNGDEDALSGLMPLVYPELRRIARKHLARGLPAQTLESAALVNEAYLKLIRAHGLRCENRLQFFALCAQIIRHILVDHARKRRYAKRGGGAVQVPLDEALIGARTGGADVLALNEALETLSKVDPRKGRVVELRYFGGLSVEETAEVLQVSPETAKRDWKIAKAWLLRELSGATRAAVRSSDRCETPSARESSRPEVLRSGESLRPASGPADHSVSFRKEKTRLTSRLRALPGH
jgi:RNA polymerase sigma-70 factor (ECF subfamily)